MKRLFMISATALLLAACSTDKVSLSGEFAACPEEMVYLETVTKGAVVDSVATNRNGAFRFKVSLPGGEPTLYNLRCAERNITLLLAAGEKVVVKSVPGLLDGYTVSGSKESELLKEIKNIMVFGSAKLDSMRTVYNQTSSKEIHDIINKDFTKEYLNIKRRQIAFIVENAGSLAAVYALNQRIPGDETLFGGRNDIVYYRMVADSVEKNYPTSPYLAGLKESIAQYDNMVQLEAKLNEAQSNPQPFPEIEIADMYGKKQRLSESLGKVILLDFWSLADQNAGFHNAELKKLYARYKESGLEIYQVSVDSSKPAWVDAVQKQKLPWISVCDFKGGASPAVSIYGVKTVPYNFLIDKKGNIVGRGLYGENMHAAVAKLFN